jgi:hypothetical protein
VVLPPHTTETPLGRNQVELDIASVVDPTRISEVCSIGVVGLTTVWSKEGADVMFVFSWGLYAVVGCMV